MALPLIPIIGAAVGIPATLFVALRWKNKRDKEAGDAAIATECERQRIALEQAVVAGSSPATIQQIRVNLAACVRAAGNAGIPIDTAAIGILPCRLQREYIERVMTDYKGTNYADPVARDGKRGAMYSAGEEMVRCLASQVEAATSAADLRAVMSEIRIASDQSRARAVCFFEGGAGCGRFAENEQHGNERGMKEIESIAAPLGGAGGQWFSGYGAIGFGERFRAAANLQDRSRELAEGDSGGLMKVAEAKLATFSPTVNTTYGIIPGALRGVRITLGG